LYSLQGAQLLFSLKLFSAKQNASSPKTINFVNLLQISAHDLQL